MCYHFRHTKYYTHNCTYEYSVGPSLTKALCGARRFIDSKKCMLDKYDYESCLLSHNCTEIQYSAYNLPLPTHTHLFVVWHMMTSWNGNISALLALCVWNQPANSGFYLQRGFGLFFDVSLNKMLNKQSSFRWFDTLSHPHDVIVMARTNLQTITYYEQYKLYLSPSLCGSAYTSINHNIDNITSSSTA